MRLAMMDALLATENFREIAVAAIRARHLWNSLSVHHNYGPFHLSTGHLRMTVMDFSRSHSISLMLLPREEEANGT